MSKVLLNGCEFLLVDMAGVNIFTPEDFTSEQKQIADTAENFINKEILPEQDRIENQDFEFIVNKMRRCAELGLFLVDIPEEFGGLELDKATGMLLIEKVAPTGSFAITYGGQTGIGLLPIVYYGTQDQKERYLGKLASGEWIGAYALTEPGSGSDALSARTTAVLSGDGSHYVLNGVKQFITNSSFADLFTVFAKIDGEQFSAFLVEKSCAGFSVGIEEKKMGLKGSSTTQLVLENVKVPVSNLLGEPGKGHKIAFNVLNVGRLKVAATTSGIAKAAFGEAASYAGERKQFGRTIGEFGAVKEKLADMTAAIFASESVVYRVAGLLDDRIATLEHGGPDYYERYQKAIEEYAAECAIAKVFCSEMLDWVVDEAVQIHGGYGYISEYPVERFYRDSRIQRIFEGTNEINRILIPTILLRKAESKGNALWHSVIKSQERIAGDIPAETAYGGVFSEEASIVASLKQIFLAVMGEVDQFTKHQEVMIAIADMIINIFALESVILRADKSYVNTSETKQELLKAVIKVATFDRLNLFQNAAFRCCAYTFNDMTILDIQKNVAMLSVRPSVGLLDAKHKLSHAALESGKYIF